MQKMGRSMCIFFLGTGYTMINTFYVNPLD